MEGVDTTYVSFSLTLMLKLISYSHVSGWILTSATGDITELLFTLSRDNDAASDEFRHLLCRECDDFIHMFALRSSVPVVSRWKSNGESDKERLLLDRSRDYEEVEISTSCVNAILWDYAHIGSEICSQASVGRTEKLCLTVAQYLLDTINVKPGSFKLEMR
ncbi:hypothetical protein TNCV_4927531 [Trichonephila clavipes]|nr:hypothetical protein TNCV_4927531 [Trichonephila clavipes]